MNVTLEITVESIEEHLLQLNVLDRAGENGELDFPFVASPASNSFSAINEDSVRNLHPRGAY